MWGVLQGSSPQCCQCRGTKGGEYQLTTLGWMCKQCYDNAKMQGLIK